MRVSRRPARLSRRLFIRYRQAAAACLLVWASLAAAAEEPDRPAAAERLRQVEQSAAAAALAQQHLRDAMAQQVAAFRALNEQAAALAGSVQDNETVLSALEADLRTLETRQAAGAETLARGRQQQGRLLAALERLALRPPEALAFAAPDPLDAVRAADLSAATLQALRESAGRLKDDLALMAALARETAQKRDAVVLQRLLLAAEQVRLAAAVTGQQALRRRDALDLQALSGRLAMLGGEAADLRDLIQRLDRETEAAREKPETAPPARIGPAQPDPAQPDPAPPEPAPASRRVFDPATAKLRYPAVGRITRRWGETDAFGGSAKGLTVQTRWGAEVVAPFDGQIVFAGEFKGYGRILIIEHAGGYHSVLTGLDRIDGRPGEWVTAGAPVGRMAEAEGRDVSGTDGKAVAALGVPDGGPADGPLLYLEFRQAGQPVDPQRWLTPRETAK